MKKISFFLILFISYAAFAQSGRLDLRSLLSKQDLVFDTLSTKWEEGAFLGNGLLGVMVYREAPDAIRFDLGRTDVTDHREGINPSIGKARLPIGKFVLRTASTIINIRLRLNLWNAELTGTLTTEKETISIRVLIPATKDIILIQIPVSTKEDSYAIEWIPEAAISPFLTLGRDSAEKYEPNPPAIQKTSNGIHFHYQPLLAGGGFTTAWKNMASEKGQSLVITITNSATPPFKTGIEQSNLNKKTGGRQSVEAIMPAGEMLMDLNAVKLEALINAHRQHWHAFYQRSAISIPDKRLEGF
jgi:alpha-L-fucosidase 2